jgi:hypothetical protein
MLDVMPLAPEAAPFVERRQQNLGPGRGVERRQFADSHESLPPRIAELSQAIDRYKLVHRRRFITVEELYNVITELGYRK